MAEINFDNVSCWYKGSPRPAVTGLNLTLADGEFMVLVGPSGCGKTTSLRMLGGLEEVSEGRITMNGKEITDVPAQRRDIAMVFQSYALYPTMTVRQNIEFPLKVAGVSRSDRAERADVVARMLDLDEFMERKPKALSGGQRQRVAMGRAIIRRPQAFLLDEPLSNLDAKLRVQTRTQIAGLQRELGVTTLYVTHDQVEAMTMGDRVAVMKDSQLQQCGTPSEIYRRPANTFVAGFVGSPPMNLLRAGVQAGGTADLGATSLPIPEPSVAGLNGDREVIVGLRPEAFSLVGEGGIPIRIGVVEILGSEAYAYGTAQIRGGEEAIVLRVDPDRPPVRGELVHARAEARNLHVFSAETSTRLG